MYWKFIAHLEFYAVLGLILVAPVAFFVGAVNDLRIADAFRKTKGFFDQLDEVVRYKFLPNSLKVTGLTATLFLFAIFAYYTDRLGDTVMPKLSPVVGHFGEERLKWSIEQEGDWGSLKFNYRVVTNIHGDRKKWEDKKTELGKGDVRLFRTLVFYFVLLAIAGVVDLSASGKFRRRGVSVLLIGILGTVLCIMVWAERKDKYIENLVADHADVYTKVKKEPPHFPDSYPSALIPKAR